MRTSKKLNTELVVLIVLGGGLLFRLIIATIWGYSNDELSAITRTRYSSISELIREGVMLKDMHPAGVQVFMAAWRWLFGSTEWVMRLPFILASTLGLYFYYRFFEIFFSKPVRLCFLILASFLYFPVVHTVFARPYAFGLFFTGIALFAFAQFRSREKFSFFYWLLLSLSWTGILYTHYFAALFAGWLALLLLFLLPRQKIIPFLLSGLAAALLFSPHISITLHHLQQGGLGWLPPPESNFLWTFLAHSLNESWWLISVLGAASLVGLTFQIREKSLPLKALLWCFTCFMGIFIIAYVYSLQSTPILKFMVLLFPWPMLMILFAQLIYQPYIFLGKTYWVGLSLVVLASSVLDQKIYDSTQQFGVFREPINHLKDWQEEYGQSAITAVANVNHPNYLHFYQENDKPLPFDWYQLNYKKPEKLESTLQQASTEYFAYTYSTQAHIPKYHEMIRRYYPTLVEGYQYFNSGVWLYKKGQSGRNYKATYNFPKPVELVDSAGWFQIPADDFSPAETLTYLSVDDAYGDYLLFSAQISLPKGGNASLVGLAQEDGRIINIRGDKYYRTQGLHGSKNTQTLRLAIDIIAEELSDNSVFKFYVWNRGTTPVYIKNLRLRLVDPEE